MELEFFLQDILSFPLDTLAEFWATRQELINQDLVAGLDKRVTSLKPSNVNTWDPTHWQTFNWPQIQQQLTQDEQDRLLEWARLNVCLGHIYQSYPNRFRHSPQESRSKGVRHFDWALRVFGQKYFPPESQLIADQLDRALQLFCEEAQKVCHVNEDPAITQIIDKNTLNSIYIPNQDNWSYGEVVAQILITVSTYGQDKPPRILREKQRWRKGQHHLIILIQGMNLKRYSIPGYEEDKNFVLGVMTQRSKLLQLYFQEKFSVSQNLKVFLKERGRLNWWLYDRLNEQNTENKVLTHIPDAPPSPWESLLRKETVILGAKVRDYIEQDPDGKLRNCHLKDRPHCNCHVLARHRLLNHPSTPWSVLATSLEQDTLSGIVSLWNRKCIPLLKKTVHELGDR